MVLAIGTATAVRLLPQPRANQPKPFVRQSLLKVMLSDSSVLNISFRKTSKGFVNNAPAAPATTDFLAERTNPALRSSSSLGGRHCSIASLTETAITYFGTVFRRAALVPHHNAVTPRVSKRCLNILNVGNNSVRKLHPGSWIMMDARVNGWFATCTSAEMKTGGSADAMIGPWPFSWSHRRPTSDPKKIAARAHVMPTTTFKHPRQGGTRASRYRCNGDVAFRRYPDWPMAAAFQSGKHAKAETPDAAKYGNAFRGSEGLMPVHLAVNSAALAVLVDD